MRDRTDTRWAILQPLLPSCKRTSRPRADDRCALDARTQGGALWRLLHLCIAPYHYVLSCTATNQAVSMILAFVTKVKLGNIRPWTRFGRGRRGPDGFGSVRCLWARQHCMSYLCHLDVLNQTYRRRNICRQIRRSLVSRRHYP